MLNDTQFILEELVYYPTRTQNPVPLRPYVFNIDNAAVETIGQRMEENKTAKITPGMLNGVAAGIVQPSTVGFESVVNQSWVSTQRFLFMLKVRHIDHMGSELNTYVFGYTEFDGITQGGDIDLEMQHYINNVIETVSYMVQTPLGPQRMEKLNNIYNAFYSASQQDVYTQRPVDMYQSIVSSEMASMMPSHFEVSHAGNLVTPFSNNVVTSTMENNITTEYLSKILTSGLHAVKSREIHVNSYQIGSDDPAERFFTEPSINDSQFFRALSRAGGSRVTRPTFNFNALMRMDNTIYQRFTMYNLTQDFASPILSRTPEVGEYWVGQDIVTIKAFSLMENCVAMATKYGFTKLSFMSSNMGDMTGQIVTSILDFNSFLNLTEQGFNYLLEIFQNKFRDEIFLNETNAGRVPLHMECHINLLGTSKIYLEYSGYHGKWFTIPTYASSHYSAVLSTDQGMVDYSATELNKALGGLIEAQPPMYY